MRTLPALLLLLLALPAAAQEAPPADAYGDEAARGLVRLARARRAGVDTRIRSYQATAHDRFSARLEVAGAERLIWRREVAARIDWTRDTVRVEVLGAREAQPLAGGGPRRPPADVAGMVPGLAFDPTGSGMILPGDTTLLLHPLAEGSEALYRFASGDTTSIRLPDGRTFRLLELRVGARRPDPRLINGSLWLDSETHAVVRAAFRLSRPRTASASNLSVLAPEVTADLEHMTIEYGLWDLRWWLPQTVVARGVVQVMGRRVPLAYERRYDVTSVVGDTLAAAPAQAAASPSARPCRPPTRGSIQISVGSPRDSVRYDTAWDAAFARSAARVAAGDTSSTGEACARRFLVTLAEGTAPEHSPVFEGSVYDDAGGPVTEAEIRELRRVVEAIPGLPWSVAAPRLQLLTADLVRANRVEGLSLGARAVLPLGPAELRGEVRAGTAGEVGARLSAVRPGPRVLAEGAVYRGLEAVEVGSNPFSIASTLGTLLLGRDENDYFRGTGAELRLSPPAARRQWWELRLFGERQEPVRTRTDLSLRAAVDDDFRSRPNLAAEPLDQVGATLRLRAARGDDPGRVRLRSELELHAEAGERSFARPLLRLEADGALAGPLGFGVALAAGTGVGGLSPQREWQVGGATTVRGHDPAALRGESLWLARGEIGYGSPGLRLSLFGDAGWAGESGAAWEARPLRGAGVGLSLLDNFLRLDLARGIGGGGVRLHLRMGGSF